jgi:hypothetical protein
MPVITNFGDVATTGNTLLFGNLTVLNTSTVLSGNLLPNVSGSSNLGQLGSQFGSAFVRSINALSINVTTQANVVSLNVSGTAFFANSTLNISNVTTANITTANVSSSLNVSGTTFLIGANIVTANVTSGNITTANISSSLNVSGTTFLIGANIVTANVTSANLTTANISSRLNVSGTTFLIGANIVTANVTSGNLATANISSSLNVSGTTFLIGANIITANVTSGNVSTGNVSTLNVATLSATTLNITSASNLLGTTNVTTLNVSSVLSASSLNVTTASNLSTTNALTMNVTTLSASSLNVTAASNLSVCNTSTLNVSGSSILFQANVLTANITSGNVLTANVTSLNVSGTAFLSNANVLTANISTGNIVSLNVTGDANIANLRIASNLITNNIIMASNLSTNSGFGNVYLTGNLVVNGNIFSSGGSVGSGSGTSQGVLFTYAASNTLPAAFATGTAGPGIAGYHLNLTGFTPEATQSVTQFTYTSGMLKFSTAGLYQVTCVIAGDQPAVKVAVGKTSSATFPPVVTATAGYDYVYNYPTGASPSHVVTLPLTVTDITQYYYLDVFLSTVAGTPSVLYPTRSTTAAGSAYGTYIQVAPFGNYLTSATGVASALLANCVGSSNLSGVYSSNAYRLTLTSANGWTVNGTSTSLAVTANGNFQVNQTGIYEVNLCLNAVGNTPVQFQVGSLASDTLAPGTTTPAYLFSYAPMYTQDPTTAIQLPLNITNVANVYFVECSFPGTVTGNVALSNVSTFVSIKPIGGYISTGTDPWIQQGTSVYYNGGPVGIGGVIPTSLTETFTVNGNTSFVGNITVTSDASGNAYVLADRVPTGSLHVSSYVTGSVPLTTTTNLIQNYLSNAASITANTGTGSITQALYCPGTANSGVRWPSGGHSVALANLALSNLFIEAWVNPSVTGSTMNILQRGTSTAEIALQITGARDVAFVVSNTSTPFTAVTTTTPINAGTWYHISGSYQRTGLTAGTVRVFVNGTVGATTATLSTTQPFITSTANVWIGTRYEGLIPFFGNVADVRVWSGGIVPTATFASPAAAPFGSTQPSYLTGTPTLLMSLNSQYFPGASTSPYGPCLTLPGTVGSYYSNVNTAYDTNWKTNGFCLEAWVNYASLANSNVYNAASIPLTIGHYAPTGAGTDWAFGATTTGQLAFWYYNGAGQGVVSSVGALVTGQWTHVVVQSNGTNIWLAVNGTFVSGAGTAISGTPVVTAGTALTIGQVNNNTPPNFAVAKARLVFGTAGSPTLGNVYSSGNFTANPNFATVPAGATVAWSLDSQYPLPTYPSIQDVTPLPSQLTSYGAVPTPIGGVTSNTLSPYSTTYPQLDSIRFDGTGYIDYGNAASSVVCSNIWNSPWTIEGWVYTPTATFSASQPIVTRAPSYSVSTYPFDFYFWIQTTGQPQFYWNTTGTFVVGGSVSIGWNHVAVVNTGSAISMYLNGTRTGTTTTPTNPFYTPSYSLYIGSQGPVLGTYYTGGTGNLSGNLADLRVSNVARYTGSSYTVPNVADGSAPFTTDSSTLLLLKSLAGQVGTTLEVQGRGLNAVSLGATRSVQSYPPAPMSSYLLDTTSNASVTYGQGKYVASASGDFTNQPAWQAFDRTVSTIWGTLGSTYNGSTPGLYIGSVTTVDTIGNSYTGEWLQVQNPVSILLSNYSLQCDSGANYRQPYKWWILGSRDGINWTLVDQRTGITWSTSQVQTFTVGATQAYNYYRCVVNQINSGSQGTIAEWTLNGLEESLCVTSDAKVGVGIANPQRALEVAGDLVVSGTVSCGNPVSFRNRIINGDMRIAQRGTSFTVTNSLQYTVDRFRGYLGSTGGIQTMTQQTLSASDTPYQYGFRYSQRVTMAVGTQGGVTTVDQNAISQVIEGYHVADLNWGTSFGSPVTVSFWFRSNLATGSVMPIAVRNQPTANSYVTTFTTTGPGTWQYVTATVPPPPNGVNFAQTTAQALLLDIAHISGSVGVTVNAWNAVNQPFAAVCTYWTAQAGNYVEATGVQLEKGTVATGFEFRPFAQELALCQRYYQKSYDIGTNLGTNTVVGAITVSGQNTDQLGGFIFKVPMRTAPTSNIYSTSGTLGKATASNGGLDTTGSVTGYQSGQNSITYYSGFGGGLTVGTGYRYQYFADAELY